MTILPSLRAWTIRSVEMFRIRALVWKLSVTIPIWAPVKLIEGTPSDVDRHRHQGDADLLAGREEHVHLAGRGPLVDLLGQDDQLVGRVPPGRDDHQDLLAPLVGRDRPAGRGQDLLRIGDARPAELLHQEGHWLRSDTGGSAGTQVASREAEVDGDFCLFTTRYLLIRLPAQSDVKERGHQLVTPLEGRAAGFEGGGFIVGQPGAGEADAGHRPGDPGPVVGLGPDQGGVVGRDEDPAAVGGDRPAERADDLAVDPLQGLDLGVGPAFVAGLVGGLDVDADDVVVLQGLDPGPPLGRVVGVEVAGRARDVDPVPAGEDARPPGRGRRPRGSPPSGRGATWNLGSLGAFPCPQSQMALAGGLPRGQPVAVDRVVADDLGPGGDQLAEQFRPGPPGQVVGGRLVGLVVGRGGQGVVAERGGPARPPVDHQVPVADAGEELDLGPARASPGGPRSGSGLPPR